MSGMLEDLHVWGLSDLVFESRWAFLRTIAVVGIHWVQLHVLIDVVVPSISGSDGYWWCLDEREYLVE